MSTCYVNTYNPIIAKLYGRKPTISERLISLRSKLTHTEFQFSERYKNISYSATIMDPSKGVRFKLIKYTHAERWASVPIQLTDTQEDQIFELACQYADLDHTRTKHIIDNNLEEGKCYFGPNTTKYDTGAAALSFILEWNLYKPSDKKVFCTEVVFMLLQSTSPEILIFQKKQLKPHSITPELGDMIIRNYIKCSATP